MNNQMKLLYELLDKQNDVSLYMKFTSYDLYESVDKLFDENLQNKKPYKNLH